MGRKYPLRILDEAEFWKHQEEEHTVVIRQLMSGLEQEFVEALKQWEAALAQTHQLVIRYIESIIRSGTYVPDRLYGQVYQLIRYCLEQSLLFVKLCEQIKATSAAIQSNPTAKVVLNHIIRESEYFIGISQVLLYQQENRQFS